jgi:hypothetical protein
MATDNTTIVFQNKMDYFINKIPNSMYIFEVTKVSCGYGEFFIIYKDNTLLDLHKNISLQFTCYQHIKCMYMINNKTMEKIYITYDKDKTIRNFIVENNCFTPIYEVPNPVVYKIYFDYGCCNGHCF